MFRLALIARDSSSDFGGREESPVRNRHGLAAGFERERRGEKEREQWGVMGCRWGGRLASRGSGGGWGSWSR
jgi:hypothetical protein